MHKALKIIIIAIALTSAGISCIIVLANLNAGFDVTDESYYILSAQYPGDVLNSITFFGYVTHVLFLLSFGNLALFRLYGIILSCASFIYLAYRTFLYCKLPLERWFLPSIGVISLLHFVFAGQHFLVTPSYNTLAFVAACLFCASFLGLFLGEKTKYINADNAVLVFSGWLAFLSKPPLAVAIFLLYFTYVVHQLIIKDKKRTLAQLSINLGLLVVLILVQLAVTPDGLSGFIKLIMNGLEYQKMMQHGGDNILAFIKDLLRNFIYISPEKALMFVILPALATYITRSNAKNYALKDIYLLFNSFLVLTVFFRADKSLVFIDILYTILGVFIVLILGALLARLKDMISKTKFADIKAVQERINGKSEPIPELYRLIVVSILFIVVVMGATIGTNNSYHVYLIYYMPLCLLYFIVLFYKVTDSLGHTRILVIALSVISAIFVFKSFNTPYRNTEPLKMQKQYIRFRGLNGEIRVSDSLSEYARSLQAIADNNGWENGMYLLDMTGATPGANLILGAKFISMPWQIGGYGGSEQLFNKNVDIFYQIKNNEKVKPWVLIAENSERKIDVSALLNTKIDFNKYKFIGKVNFKYSDNRTELHELYAPAYD